MPLVENRDGQVTIDAPAKINLFLEVLNKREDGFHNINSLFQAVSLCDRLTFQPASQPGVEIRLSQPLDLPLDNRNLIARTYHLVKSRYSVNSGLNVFLEKNIPVAAGLAGGSADGAATIKACNLLFGLGLSNSQMATLSLEIGSDLPFFFSGGQALVAGRGQELRPTELPSDYWLLLVTPAVPVSTAEAYAALKMGLTNSKEPFRLRACRSVEDMVAELRLAVNDFERIHMPSFPELRSIREGLLASGAMLVRMSGSGPTMFGLYDKRPAEESVQILRRDGWRVNLARPISLEE